MTLCDMSLGCGNEIKIGDLVYTVKEVLYNPYTKETKLLAHVSKVYVPKMRGYADIARSQTVLLNATDLENASYPQLENGGLK